jgi:hypothetical protein
MRVKDILLCCDHKKGLSPEDFEDAFTPLSDIEREGRMRFAIADGATESSFSKEWAQLLVKKFRSSGFSVFDKDVLAELATEWGKGTNQSNLSWYNQEKVSLGSYAALLGFEADLTSGECKATAVGDCCMMLLRGGMLLFSFPIESADGFSNRPLLIGTKDGIPTDGKKEARGSLQEGDMLVFASDALAAWILGAKDNRGIADLFLDVMSDERRVKEKNAIMGNFEKISKVYENEFSHNHDYFSRLALEGSVTADQVKRWRFRNLIFRDLIARERDNSRLKNDDVTLCVIQF